METITVVSKLLYHSGVDLLSTQNNVLVDRNYVTNELVGIEYWEQPGTFDNPLPNDKEYKEGDLVQHHGKVYKCLKSFAVEEPGSVNCTEWAPTTLRVRNKGVIDLREVEDGPIVTSPTISHNLNSKNILVQVYKVNEQGAYELMTGYTAAPVSLNEVQIDFTSLEDSFIYRVLITSLD